MSGPAHVITGGASSAQTLNPKPSTLRDNMLRSNCIQALRPPLHFSSRIPDTGRYSVLSALSPPKLSQVLHSRYCCRTGNKPASLTFDRCLGLASIAVRLLLARKISVPFVNFPVCFIRRGHSSNEPGRPPDPGSWRRLKDSSLTQWKKKYLAKERNKEMNRL